MHLTSVFRALGPIDLRNIRRDAMLRWLVLAPVLLALLLRWLTPTVTEHVRLRYEFALEPYYPLIASFMALTTPLIAGALVGFVLLDQRDDGTLSALQVTPLTLDGYFVYRLATPLLVSVAMTMITVPLTGLVRLGWPALALVALAAAPLAPLFALLFAGFAANKVQGFALMKAAGVLNWPPLIGWFLPLKWQWFTGIVPTYWPAKVFWMIEAGESGVWAYLAIGLIYQSGLLVLLLKRFNRVLHRG